eukprot:CAMPEP_0113628626 /NCGR_PEP_ID=MMETSP0017_2-20120614/14834_1 /TAXON_ID=2856 /ORGANISM="Cylindrotheca closterium" /LENGTH=95 /DNA_ID=CAMNT_0000538941 /DNA_START=239 /DNA_END=523 /DNA_ORIENTATION=+ /assembly_acc=CAM_ASM_000147
MTCLPADAAAAAAAARGMRLRSHRLEVGHRNPWVTGLPADLEDPWELDLPAADLEDPREPGLPVDLEDLDEMGKREKQNKEQSTLVVAVVAQVLK